MKMDSGHYVCIHRKKGRVVMKCIFRECLWAASYYYSSYPVICETNHLLSYLSRWTVEAGYEDEYITFEFSSDNLYTIYFCLKHNKQDFMLTVVFNYYGYFCPTQDIDMKDFCCSTFRLGCL